LKAKKIQGKLKIYDYNFSPMDIEKKPDSGEIVYIRADTNEAVDFINKWFEEEGYCAHIKDIGFWYCDDGGNWLDLEQVTHHFNQVLQIMQQDKMLDD
jgi:elongation factor P hydroxylase